MIPMWVAESVRLPGQPLKMCGSSPGRFHQGSLVAEELQARDLFHQLTRFAAAPLSG